MRAQIDKPQAELLWATIKYRDELVYVVNRLQHLSTTSGTEAAWRIVAGLEE